MNDKPIVYDLDILRPPPEYVKLAGKQIDISFIPSGIAIDFLTMQRKLSELADTDEKIKKLDNGEKESKGSWEIIAGLCAKITESQYPEMNKEWLLKNTNVDQLSVLMERISIAIKKSLKMEEDEGKN